MSSLFNPPTRDQLAKVAAGDQRLLRAFEQLFQAVGQILPDDLSGIISDIDGLLVTPNAPLIAQLKEKQSSIRSIELGQLVFVSDKYDFPPAVSGVITLKDNVAYHLTSSVDLLGDRIVGADNSVISGPSQSLGALTSTGLSSTALLTSTKALNLNNIDIHDVDIALDLDADDPSDFLVWARVNFTNCPIIGTIKDYNNVVMTFGGISNSAGLTFDGTIGTIGLSDMFLSGVANKTTIIIPSTAIITRRFRVRFSAMITPSTGTALDVSTSATIPDESYLLFDVNFSGDGARISGVQHHDNAAMFTSCIGIENSRTFANYYMTNNSTPTPVTVNTPTKALGTTTDNPISQRFTFTNNRATYTGALSRAFTVEAWASLSSNNNNVLRLYIAKNGTAITTTFSEGTANAAGKSEGLVTASVVELDTNDFIEVFVSNETGGNNIIDIHLNVIVSEL